MEVIRASLVLRAARTCGYSSLLVLTLLALSRHRAPCLGPAPAIASPAGSCQSKSGMLAAPSNNSRSVWREWSSLVVNGTRSGEELTLCLCALCLSLIHFFLQFPISLFLSRILFELLLHSFFLHSHRKQVSHDIVFYAMTL